VVDFVSVSRILEDEPCCATRTVGGQPLQLDVVAMHGDLLNGLTNSIFVPLCIYKVATEPLPTPAHYLISLTFAVTTLASFRSWWCYDYYASWIAYFATKGSIVGVCLYHWPLGDEPLIVVQLIWELLVCSANVCYPFSTKVVMGVLSACTTLWLSYMSPAYTVRENLLTVVALLGTFGEGLCRELKQSSFSSVAHMLVNSVLSISFETTAIHIGINYVISRTEFAQNGINLPKRLKREAYSFDFRERKVEYAAMFILLIVFLYFVGYEIFVMMMQPGGAVAGAYKITRAGLFGASGLIAGGAFRNDKDMDASESARQAESLRIARMALNTSDTAMTFTDPHRTILWCNPSFLRIAGAAVESEVQGTLLEVALSLSAENVRKLDACFRQGSAVEVELLIRGMTIHMKVSPSVDCQIANGFVVVLKDVTEERSLEQFIQSSLQVSHATIQAQNDAMRARARNVLAPMDQVTALSNLVGDNIDTEQDESRALGNDTFERASFLSIWTRTGSAV
jgi:PAS domain-containing protein